MGDVLRRDLEPVVLQPQHQCRIAEPEAGEDAEDARDEALAQVRAPHRRDEQSQPGGSEDDGEGGAHRRRRDVADGRERERDRSDDEAGQPQDRGVTGRDRRHLAGGRLDLCTVGRLYGLLSRPGPPGRVYWAVLDGECERRGIPRGGGGGARHAKQPCGDERWRQPTEASKRERDGVPTVKAIRNGKASNSLQLPARTALTDRDRGQPQPRQREEEGRSPLPPACGWRLGRLDDSRLDRGGRSSRSSACAVVRLTLTPRPTSASFSASGESVSASSRSSRMLAATMYGACPLV